MGGSEAARLRSAAIVVRADMSPDMAEAYVASHPHASAYHRPAWLGVIARAFGHEVKYLVAQSGDAIVGVLPLVLFSSRLFGRFGVSIPFVNYGGVLANDAAAARALVDAAVDATRSAGGTHLELRHTTTLCPGYPARRHKVAMRLRLEADAERLWNRLDRKLRNQVRKAEKSDMQVESGGLELVPAFYAVFARNMRDLGTPVYAVRFFEEVVGTFPEASRVFVVTHHGQPVAASIVHGYRGTIEVPWASSLREFNPLCANVFLYWQMLRFACERGFDTFDFGRSTPGEGTYKFKEQWGAEASELVWEYWLRDGGPLPNLNPSNPKFDMAIRAWQHLPMPVTTRLGPLIVRNIP